MHNLHLVSLGDEAIREAATYNYPLWGGGRRLDEHIARVFEGRQRLAATYMGLCESGGKLLAALKLYEIALRLEGCAVPALGIGAVHVPESERGKGFGREIVKRSMEHAASRGARGMLLFSDIDPRFYEELGFTRLAALDWRADPSCLPAVSAYSIRPAGEADMESLLEWHAQACAPYAVSVSRSAASWRGFRWFRGSSEDLVLSDGEEDVGYIAVDASRAEMEVIEGWSPDRERYWATASVLAAKRGCTGLSGWAPSVPHESWMIIRERTAAVPMVAMLGEQKLPSGASSWFSSADHF